MGMLIKMIVIVLTTTISCLHISMLPNSKLIAVLISICVPIIIKEFTPHHISMVLIKGIFERKTDKQTIDVIPLTAAPNNTRMLSGRMLFNKTSLQLLYCAKITVNTTEIIATTNSNIVFDFFAKDIQYSLLT